MANLTTNQKIAGGALQAAGFKVSDGKLFDNNFLASVGAQILESPDMINKFYTSLVNRIGKVYINAPSYKNPLENFKKGNLPFGVAIEDIYVNFYDNYDYTPDSTLMSDEFKDDVIAVYYTINSYKKFYCKTSYKAFAQAFTNWAEMDNFINKILSRLYDSQQLYEWETTKNLIGNDFNAEVGAMRKQELTYYPSTFAQDLSKLLRATALNMTNPTSKYNNFKEYAVASGASGVTNRPVKTYSTFDSLNLLVRNDVLADIDIDVLSVAFNMDKAKFMGKVHSIDNFGTTNSEKSDDNTKTYTKIDEYESTEGTVGIYDLSDYTITEGNKTYNVKLLAVICDDTFIHIEDTEVPQVMPFIDPSNLITTTYLHSWQTYALCPFANALAIYTKTEIV